MAGFQLFLKSIYILYSQRAVVIQLKSSTSKPYRYGDHGDWGYHLSLFNFFGGAFYNFVDNTEDKLNLFNTWKRVK